MRSYPLATLGLAFAGACVATPALAEPTPADRIAAQALFADAQAAMTNLDFRTACPKFAESQRLDPGVGTLYHLGVCYEAEGRVASAWTTFRDAAETARRAGQGERSAKARARADALEARIPWLNVTVVGPDRPRLTLDGSPFADALVGTSVPLDPGPHELAAEAQGKKPWTTRVEPREGATLEVSIPALEDAAALTPPVAPPAPPPVEPAAAVPSEKPATPPIEPIVTTPQRRRVDWHVPTAIAAAGAGVIALGFGTALGITAINEWAAARPGCPGNNCTPPAAAEWSSAHNAGVASTVSFVAGGVLVAGGAAVWFTRVDAPASVGVRPDGAVVVAGRWP